MNNLRKRPTNNWIEEHERISLLLRENPLLFQQEKEKYFLSNDEAEKFYLERQQLIFGKVKR